MRHDPITRFTDAERELIDRLNRTLDHDTALAQLKALLQVAIEIELATIPIYLYTYYSIQRTIHSGQQVEPSDVFANKAGGLVMSVAVEEMLHMSLSSNILFALGGRPQIYMNAPASYPTGLPHHNPVGPRGPHGETDVLIPLGKFGYEQLWRFLEIEYPEGQDAVPQDDNWDSIGQVYSYIRCLIACDWIHDEDFRKGEAARQIQPYNYSPDNTDTVYVSGKFDPWTPAPAPGRTIPPDLEDQYPSGAHAAIYANMADSHAGPTELVTVTGKTDAFIAIDTICDQGEGFAQPHVPTEPTDDPSKREDSHYFKFLTLQAQLEEYPKYVEQLPADPTPPGPIAPTVGAAELAKVIADYPKNPVTADYPDLLQPISDFCNGVFQYMLILTETLHCVDPKDQKRFFNEGMHRSMIWVLDKYIQTMRQIKIWEGKHQGHIMAPTFENLSLGTREASFAALTDLGNKAIAAAKALAEAHPEDKDAAGNVVYYVNKALTDTDPSGASMHLPDVAPYWNGNEPVFGGL